MTDANNHTTTYSIRQSGSRRPPVQFPDATTNLYSYNSQGNVIKFTDGRSNSTTYSFDALNRETGSTDALNDITTITLDAAGNVTEVQAPTPAGQTARTTTYAYDSMNRLGTVTDALGQQTIIGHDSDGNVTTVKDPLGRITTTQFDQMDRPVVVIDPMGNRVTTTYDKNSLQRWIPPRYGISCMARIVSLHQARSFVRGRSMVISVCPGQRTQIKYSQAIGPRVGPDLPILKFVNASNADHLPVTDDLACMIGTPGRSIDRSGEPVESREGKDVYRCEFCCRGGIWSTA